MGELMLILVSTIKLGAPLVLAALGGLLSERSGVINIALEGKMLAAACLSAVVGLQTQNPALALAAGVTAAIVLSLLHWLLTQVFRMDHIISGMGINALSLGGTNFIGRIWIDPATSDKVGGIPVQAFWFAALGAAIGLWLMLKRTMPGLRLLAVGNDPDKSRQMGVNPLQVRAWALVGTGVLAGLAGVLIAFNAGGYQDNMTAGRGYIALAALILGGWRPLYALGGCLLFAFFEALQIHLQGKPLFGVEIPNEMFQAMPYLVTLLALAGFLGNNKAPSGLGKL